MVNKKIEAITAEVVTSAMNRVLTDLEGKIAYAKQNIEGYVDYLSEEGEKDEWKVASYERFVLQYTSEITLYQHLINEICNLSIAKAKKIVQDSI
jgi:hypothetical protein